MSNDVSLYLKDVKHHLHNELLPYWEVRGVDEEFGGYLTYFDRNGNPTGETVKNLLAHARMIFAFSSIHRAGYDKNEVFLKRARLGVKFLVDHFWDDVHGGWYWITERDGKPIDQRKVIFGHSFIIYGLSEYFMASGDEKALEWAKKTFDALQIFAADNLNGGYYEFFEEDWHHCPPGVYGGDRKSMDVHMHLMEAMTNLYEATQDELHKRRAIEIIKLICSRMLHPKYGTGIAQFGADFTPKRAIVFKTRWGADRDVDDSEGRPLDNTSYGHNVEFAWLLNHSVNILGLDMPSYVETIRKLYDHCLDFGIDWKHGGVYCEGPHHGEAREKNKEFWQQAETMIAMLDATTMFDDGKYWLAYQNIHRFVFDYMVNHEVGEWFPLFSPNNELIWDYMGSAWKINYHTVRSMLECERRLTEIKKGNQK
jgi:mannobiose 2-epimerase